MTKTRVIALVRAMKTITDHLNAKFDLPFADPVVGSHETGNRHNDLPSLLTPKRVGTILGISVKTLANYRASGTGGPLFVKNGGRVFYRRQDIVDYIEGGVCSSTSHISGVRRPSKSKARQ